MVALRQSGLRRQQGFTLIELVVVIALVLVMAAIALMFVPSFQDADKAGLGARQLIGLLQMQKTLAAWDVSVISRSRPDSKLTVIQDSTEFEIKFLLREWASILASAVASVVPLPKSSAPLSWNLMVCSTIS